MRVRVAKGLLDNFRYGLWPCELLPTGPAPRAGLSKRVGPHTLKHAFITAALDAGVPLRDVQEGASHADPRTMMRHDRARVSLDCYVPTSSLPSSQAPPLAIPPALGRLPTGVP
jgi:hypothetical protein